MHAFASANGAWLMRNLNIRILVEFAVCNPQVASKLKWIWQAAMSHARAIGNIVGPASDAMHAILADRIRGAVQDAQALDLIKARIRSRL